jgi:Ca2+-binding EF-hand superfamily protein
MRVLLCLFSLFPACTPAPACEPVSADWPTFMARYDSNADGVLDQSEFGSVSDFAPYTWPVYFPDHRAGFSLLDQDHDQTLTAGELSGIYRFPDNPCAHFSQR